MARIVAMRQRKNERLAREIIEALGAEASYRMGVFARDTGFAGETREHFLAIAAEVERLQGVSLEWPADGTAEPPPTTSGGVVGRSRRKAR